MGGGLGLWAGTAAEKNPRRDGAGARGYGNGASGTGASGESD